MTVDCMPNCPFCGAQMTLAEMMVGCCKDCDEMPEKKRIVLQCNLNRYQMSRFLAFHMLGVRAAYGFAKAGDQEGMLLELRGIENLIKEAMSIGDLPDDDVFKNLDLAKVSCWEV